MSLPLSPCSCVGTEGGEDTRGSLIFTTLGASLPSPSPSKGGGKEREGGAGETDLVEAGDKGGWKLFQWGRQHKRV